MQALVIAGHKNTTDIKINGRDIFAVNKRKSVPALVAGDVVIVEQLSGKYIITKLNKRKNLLTRNHKAVASNLDYLILVVALKPHYQFQLIDRYLVIARMMNIPVKIMVNKIDLIKDAKQLKQDFKTYTNLGYNTYFISIAKKINLENLSKNLSNKRYILLGQSGVGKTSISNYLVPRLKLKTNPLDKDNKGKHTTTNTTLYHSKYGQIIDSPGMREFGLTNLKPNQIEKGFIEINAKGKHCKFRNCVHLDEPNCAVKSAVYAKHINHKRYQSYIDLIKTSL